MAHAGERRGGTHRRVFLAGLAVGAGAAALVWLGAAQWQRLHAPAPPHVEVVSTFVRSDLAREAAPASDSPAPLPPPAEPAARAAAPVTPAAGTKYAAEFPVYDKLVERPLSREPHQVIGAWDEDADNPQAGQRRAFVLAVSPGQSDSSLESLARDVRSQNLDALLLDVRVYDDADAATSPRVVDSGQRARQHLVAEIQRNPAAGLDVIRVRGRALEP